MKSAFFLILSMVIFSEGSNAICRKNEKGTVELRLDSWDQDSRQRILNLADGSAIDSIDKRCLIKTGASSDANAKIVFHEGFHSLDDNSALSLKDGSHLIFGQRSPFSAPYQRYIRIIKLDASGEAVRSFGKNGVAEIFPSNLDEHGTSNIFSGSANKAVLNSFKQLRSGSIEVIWSSCFQATFSSNGSCEGTVRTVLSTSGKRLSQRPYGK